ncbi:peptidoglycan-binding protein [Patescibacteria group bacterium]|nr:peptidoglycan-binding protein [Patescibacteria group bacterium]
MRFSVRKIIVLVLALIIVGGVWFFAFLNSDQQTEVITTTKNLFPFGEINQSGSTPTSNSQETTGSETTGGSQTTSDDTTFEVEGPRLRQVSYFPTGGFIPLTRTEEEDVVDIVVDENGIETEIFNTTTIEHQYVRYSSIADATIYESELTPSSIQEEQLVENFIPNAERARFNRDGNRVLFQYWDSDDGVPESYLARIEKLALTIEPCPFDFGPITLGEETERVRDIHTFLNRNAQTRIARSGINAPGNESTRASDATITAIKNFQSLYQIDIDGAIGPSTQAKMQEVCNDQQRRAAEELFNKQDEKYKISGFFLAQNILEADMSPSGGELFYLQKDNLGVIGVIRNLIDESKRTVFESPFSQWLVNWNNPQNIELTTKPSYRADGYTYSLDPDTNRYFKSQGEELGLLVKPSPDNSKMLIMESTNSGIQLGIFERASKRIRQLSLRTLPEKCVWLENSVDLYCGVPNSMAYGNQYPDTWYQGLETFTDSLWKINTTTLEETEISNMSREYQATIDIEDIQVDERNEYLYFIDKGTEFLWSYRLVDF